MVRPTIVLIAMCFVAATAPITTAQKREPTTLLCEGTAKNSSDKVSLAANIDYSQRLGVVLEETDTGQREPTTSITLAGLPVPLFVYRGSISVNRATPLKMLWQKAGMSQDFVGFALTLGYTSVLSVDSGKYALDITV
jgi:hypothetical protein